MTTPLATGQSGAISSDLPEGFEGHYFAKVGDELPRADLLPCAITISAGEDTIYNNWCLDLDTGVDGHDGDIRCGRAAGAIYRIAPSGDAGIAYLGMADFASITPDQLPRLDYGSAHLNVGDDPGNQLVNGVIFAVRTRTGNHAKVKVLSHGGNVQLQWTTYHYVARYRAHDSANMAQAH